MASPAALSTAAPVVMPTRSRRIAAEAAKMAMAAGIVVGLVHGYTAWEAHHAAAVEAASPLPGAALPTGPCTLWFVGSSTMFKWSATLADNLSPWDAHARGVNGASIPQVIGRFGNEPAGPAPAAIVFYSGENDIARGATPAETFAEFERFLVAKTRHYGALPVIALSLKPSPTRWSQLPAQTSYNDAVRRLAATRADLSFVDIRPVMFVGGKLGPFYLDDGIHMNPAGYARWGAALRPALPGVLPAKLVNRCTGTPTGS